MSVAKLSGVTTLVVAEQGCLSFEVHVSDNGKWNDEAINPTATVLHASTFDEALQASRSPRYQRCKQRKIILDSSIKVSSAIQLDAQDTGLEITSAAGRKMNGNTRHHSISGGVTLNGTWDPPTNGKIEGIWRLRLTSTLNSSTFNQLFVGGQRATRARHPNKGVFSVISAPLPASSSGFVYNPSDFPARAVLNAIDTVEMVIYESWQASRRKLRAIDTDNHTLLFATPASVQFNYANTGRRYYTENFYEALDDHMEWYVEGDAATPGNCSLYLYFKPQVRDGRKIDHPSKLGDFIAPVISGDLFTINGATNITISKVVFEHIDWGQTPAQWDRVAHHSGGVQGASFLNTSAIRVYGGSQNITFQNITVRHCGEYGIWIYNGSNHIDVLNAIVYDTGAGGLRIGQGKPLLDTPDGTEYCRVEECVFTDGSHVFHEGNGILLQKSSFNTIRKCEVSFFSHCGISVGWTWDYRPTEANHNLIEYNHVHHIGNGDLSDFGGIYLLGDSPGTVVRHNYIHDSYPFFKYGHGIYLDQASSNIDAYLNIVHNTEHSNFLLHYGMNNTIHNNIFAYASGGFGSIMQNSNPGWPASGVQSRQSLLIFYNNVVYVKVSKVGHTDPPLDDLSDAYYPLFSTPYRGNNSFDRNCYFNVSGSLTSTFPSWIADSSYAQDGNNRSLVQWRAVGQDKSSIVQDPQFIDAKEFDFRLANSSPVRKQPGFLEFGDVQHDAGPTVKEHFYRKRCWSKNGTQFISCGPLDLPANAGMAAVTDRACGVTVRVFCYAGYEQIGGFVRTCGDGGWSNPNIKCRKMDPHPSFLPSPGTLTVDQYMLAQGNYSESSFLIMQGDCNLAIYRGTGPTNNKGILWSTGTSRSNEVCVTHMQSDGNLCVYSQQSGHPPLWCSNVAPGNGEYYLNLSPSGRLEVRKGASPSNDEGMIWNNGVKLVEE